jgi:serine/threonine protein kinase
MITTKHWLLLPSCNATAANWSGYKMARPLQHSRVQNEPPVRTVALEGCLVTVRSDSLDLTPADSADFSRIFGEASALKFLVQIWSVGLGSDPSINYDSQQQPRLTLKLPHSSPHWTLLSSLSERRYVRAFGSVVARVLQHWHALGVVHRSLAPSAVLVDLAQAMAPGANSIVLLSWGGCAVYNWRKSSYICSNPLPHPSAVHAAPERLSFSLEMFTPLTPAEDWFSLGRILSLASPQAQGGSSESEKSSVFAFPMFDPALSVLVSDSSVLGTASVISALLDLDPVARHLNGFVVSKELQESLLSETISEELMNGLYCPTGIAWPIPGLIIHHDGRTPLSEVLCFKTHISMISVDDFDSSSFVTLGCAIVQSLFVSWNDISGNGKRRGSQVGWHLQSPSFFIIHERSKKMTLLQSIMAALDYCEVSSEVARSNMSNPSVNIRIDRDNVVAKLGDVSRQESQGVTILVAVQESELAELVEINAMLLKNSICAVFVALVDASLSLSATGDQLSKTTQIVDLTTPLANCQYLHDAVLRTLYLPEPILDKVVAIFDEKLGTSSGAKVSEFLLWSQALEKHDIIRFVPQSGMVHLSLSNLISAPISHRAASEVVQHFLQPESPKSSDLLRLCSAVSATSGDTCLYELPVDIALAVTDVSRSTLDEAVAIGLCVIVLSQEFGFEVVTLAHELFRSLSFSMSVIDMHVRFIQYLHAQIISAMQVSSKHLILNSPFRPGLVNYAVSLTCIFSKMDKNAKLELKHKLFALCEHMFALSSVGSAVNEKTPSSAQSSLSTFMQLPSYSDLTRLLLLGAQLSNGSLEHHKARSYASAGVALLSSLEKSVTQDETISLLHFQMRCDMLVSFINQNITQGIDSEKLLLQQYSEGGSSRWCSGAVFTALLQLSQSVNCLQRCCYHDAFNIGSDVFTTLQSVHKNAIIMQSDSAFTVEQFIMNFSKCVSHGFWTENLDCLSLSPSQTQVCFLQDAFERLVLPSLCCGIEYVIKLVSMHTSFCLSDEQSLIPLSLTIVPILKMIVATHPNPSLLSIPVSVSLEFVSERVRKTDPGLQFLQSCLWTAFSIIPFSSSESINLFLEAYSSQLRQIEKLSNITNQPFVYPYNGSSLLGASHVLHCVASDLSDANEKELCFTAQFFSAALSFISGCDISHLSDALSYICSSQSLSIFGERLLVSLLSVIQCPSQGPASCRKEAELLPDFFYFVILSIEVLWNLVLCDWNSIFSASKRAAVLKMDKMVQLFLMNLKFCSCCARLQQFLIALEGDKNSFMKEALDDLSDLLLCFAPERTVHHVHAPKNVAADSSYLISFFQEQLPMFAHFPGSGMLQIICALLCEVQGSTPEDICDCYDSAYKLCVRDGLYLHAAIACQFGHKSFTRMFSARQVTVSPDIIHSRDDANISIRIHEKGDHDKLMMIDMHALRQLERSHALFSVMRFDTPVLIAQQLRVSLAAAIYPDCPLSKSADHIGHLWFGSFIMHDRLLRIQGCFGPQSHNAIFSNYTLNVSPSKFSRLHEHASRLKSDLDDLKAPISATSPVDALSHAAQVIGRSIGAQQAVVLSKTATSVSLSSTIESLSEVTFLPLNGEHGDNVVAILNQNPVDNLPEWLIKFGFVNRGVHVFQNISTSFGSNLLPQQDDGEAATVNKRTTITNNSAKSVSDFLRAGAINRRLSRTKQLPLVTTSEARRSSVVMLSWGSDSSGGSEPDVCYLLYFEHKRILGMFGPDFYLNTQLCAPERFHPGAHPLAFVLGKCLYSLKYLSGSEQTKPARRESVSFSEIVIDDAASASGNQIADRLPIVGMLWKRGSIFKNWKERHFQLFNMTLKYFTKDDRIKALKALEITHDTTLLEVSAIDRKEISAPFEHCFCLLNAGWKLYLCADQSSRMKKWLKILSSTIEHARKVKHRSIESYAFNACVAPPPLQSMTIVKRLGAGGFGEVFLASWNGLLVAVKKMTKELTATTIFRFKREADMMSVMRHPNILTYMACSLDPPNLMIVMEYMRHGSLFNVLQVGIEYFEFGITALRNTIRISRDSI